MTSRALLSLTCRACGERELVGLQQMVVRLRDCGVFKREKDPDPDLVRELFEARLPEMICGSCGKNRLSASAVDDGDDEDWGQPRSCDGCGERIPTERITVFPDTRLCRKCQGAEERGEGNDELEYCPRCGTVLQMRISRRSGISRYDSYCPACRR